MGSNVLSVEQLLLKNSRDNIERLNVVISNRAELIQELAKAGRVSLVGEFGSNSEVTVVDKEGYVYFQGTNGDKIVKGAVVLPLLEISDKDFNELYQSINLQEKNL